MWAIGDVQGCYQELRTLVNLIDQQTLQSPNAALWFAGDLVNRGPESLNTLRYIKSLGSRAICVLGNHDLHMLALACGVRQASATDTMVEVLAAPDATELIDWLRHLPLAYYEATGDESFFLAHAGLYPQWSIAQALAHAKKIQTPLRSADWCKVVRNMYLNDSTDPQVRLTVNALTRMRYLTANGELDLKSKENAAQVATGLTPWFQDARIEGLDTTVVYGHWSTMGLQLHRRSIGLDTGCVWGGSLTAVHLPTRRVLQVKGQTYQSTSQAPR